MTQNEMVLRGLELKLDRILDFLANAEKSKKIDMRSAACWKTRMRAKE